MIRALSSETKGTTLKSKLRWVSSNHELAMKMTEEWCFVIVLPQPPTRSPPLLTIAIRLPRNWGLPFRAPLKLVDWCVWPLGAAVAVDYALAIWSIRREKGRSRERKEAWRGERERLGKREWLYRGEEIEKQRGKGSSELLTEESNRRPTKH